MAERKISALTASVLGDHTATTSELEVSINVTTTPVSRSITFGVLRDFLASAATGFAAVAVTVLSLSVAGAVNVPTAAISASDTRTITATASGVTTSGASWDAAPTLVGNFAYDHFYAFQSRTNWSSVSGTITDFAGFFDRPVLSAAAENSVTHRYGAWIRDYTGTNQVVTQYGLYVDALTNAGTNYAIFTNAGLVQLGGATSIGAGLFISGGDSAAAGQSVRIAPSTLTTTTQYGLVLVPNFNSSATASGAAGYARLNTAASEFTMTSGMGIQIDIPSLGAESAVTTLYGLKVEDQTLGGTNYAIYTGAGLLRFGSTVSAYNAVATAGLGLTPVYGSGRVTGKVNVASGTIATYTPDADGLFEVAANVLVTATTACTFTVTVTYTDEGNTSRTLTLTFSQITGTFLTAITNVTGVGAYEGVPLRIRAKGANAITIQTAAGGTYTGVTYNASADIIQVAA